MLLLGIDIGTSFVKVAVVDAATQQCVATAQCPDTESPIITRQSGWAEQSPELWWEHTQQAIRRVNASGKFQPRDIAAIGISYQMHGLVVVDSQQRVLRDSIIWCDSRAIDIGEKALEIIGRDVCTSRLLNAPGNFTASKLAWVKTHEPEIYQKIDKIMLPGDFIAMKLTGKITTSASALSEGIFYDFRDNNLSSAIMNYFGFDRSLIPEQRPLFSSHGGLLTAVAEQLSLRADTPVTYKAGDQPNNALSLHVLQPGEVAATAGTSGVIYAVTDQLFNDSQSRVNAFAHVNHSAREPRLGVLLCINGTGIMNSWMKKMCGDGLTYKDMDALCEGIAPGSDGLVVLPFGNGAERMLDNKTIGAQIRSIDLNKHSKNHLFRATQEGIAFAFRYGLDIMRENHLHPTVIRAGRANLFLSGVFLRAFVNATGVAVELYENDGSIGAALGAGVGAGTYPSFDDAFRQLKPIQTILPDESALYEELYLSWKKALDHELSTQPNRPS